MVAVVDGSVDRLAKRRNRMELWGRRVAEQRDSGLSVGDWCAANSCSTHSFYVWRAKLGFGIKRRPASKTDVSTASPAAIGRDSVVRLARVRVEEKQSNQPNNTVDGLGIVAGGWADGSENARNPSIRLCLGNGRELLWPMSLPLSRLVEMLVELERLTERRS